MSAISTSEILAENFSVLSVCFVKDMSEFIGGVFYFNEINGVRVWECYKFGGDMLTLWWQVIILLQGCLGELY